MSNSQFENEACVFTFTLAYMDMVLWTEKDTEGNDLEDNFGVDAFCTEARELIEEECEEFCDSWGHLFDGEETSAGQHFWMTRQAVANPFVEIKKWDKEYKDYLGNKTHIGRTLDKAASSYKEVEVCEFEGTISYL